MESKRFPKPTKLGVKAVRWASADIEQWIKDVGEKE
jgi:predicted DNA-binding transcriptional regulator AlpA